MVRNKAEKVIKPEIQEPDLGYFSLGQLREYFDRTDVSRSERGRKKIATQLFHMALRCASNPYVFVDADERVEPYYYEDEEGRHILAVTGEPDVGTLINGDIYQKLHENGELYAGHHGVPLAQGLSKRTPEINHQMIRERAAFLGVVSSR